MKTDCLFPMTLLMVVLGGLGCSSSHVVKETLDVVHSPQRTHAVLISGRLSKTKKWSLGHEAQSNETVLGIARDEHPYTEKPSTGANPTVGFLTASCPSSDFDVRWIDEANVNVAIHHCNADQIRNKSNIISGIAVSYSSSDL